ncbi:MAG: hypothetical protein P4L22_01000 [Candidatus Babeliales bacterium]|nr:hypothetical protein [Candidatus Babeliales bacterium]
MNKIILIMFLIFSVNFINGGNCFSTKVQTFVSDELTILDKYKTSDDPTIKLIYELAKKIEHILVRQKFYKENGELPYKLDDTSSKTSLIKSLIAKSKQFTKIFKSNREQVVSNILNGQLYLYHEYDNRLLNIIYFIQQNLKIT